RPPARVPPAPGSTKAEAEGPPARWPARTTEPVPRPLAELACDVRLYQSAQRRLHRAQLFFERADQSFELLGPLGDLLIDELLQHLDVGLLSHQQLVAALELTARLAQQLREGVALKDDRLLLDGLRDLLPDERQVVERLLEVVDGAHAQRSED